MQLVDKELFSLVVLNKNLGVVNMVGVREVIDFLEHLYMLGKNQISRRLQSIRLLFLDLMGSYALENQRYSFREKKSSCDLNFITFLFFKQAL